MAIEAKERKKKNWFTSRDCKFISILIWFFYSGKENKSSPCSEKHLRISDNCADIAAIIHSDKHRPPFWYRSYTIFIQEHAIYFPIYSRDTGIKAKSKRRFKNFTATRTHGKRHKISISLLGILFNSAFDRDDDAKRVAAWVRCKSLVGEI